MCGIIGISSNYKYIKSIVYLINGLKLLQNRGYDSAGISMICKNINDNNNIKTLKYASDDSKNNNNSIDQLEKEMDQFYECKVGIAHTRWATHGGKTDYNAHPHVDSENKISIVHNGIIENHNQLRNFLIENGYSFKSETDSEVIVNMVSYYLKKNNDLVESIKNVMNILEGTYAVALISSIEEYKDNVYTFCHGSPMVVGFNKKDGIAMVSSEILGFGNQDFEYTCLDNKSIAILSTNGIIFCNENEINNNRIWSKISKDEEKIQTEYDKSKYKSWLEKEIYEQPESVYRSFNNGGRFESEDSVKLGGLDKIKDRLTEIEHLILLGCGTSYYAGLYSLYILKKIGGFVNVSIYDGGEFTSLDIPKCKDENIGYIFLSQSGETKDLHRCFSIIPKNSPKIGIINVVNSMISRQVDCGVYLNAGREVSVASTKSFTNMVTVLYLLASWFSKNKTGDKHKEYIKSIISSLKVLPSQIEEVLKTDISTIDLSKIENHGHMFILGKGIGESIALEGSLKLKEIGYIHSEGKSSSSLKHGPFALIDNNLPILFIHLSSLGEENFIKVENSITEVCARDSYPIVITDITDIKNIKNKEIKIVIPYNQHFGCLLANIVIQRLALSISYKNGYNPDYPRNLAKVVTVE